MVVKVTCLRQMCTVKLFLAIAVECKRLVVPYLSCVAPLFAEVLEHSSKIGKRKAGGIAAPSSIFKGTGESSADDALKELRSFAEEAKQIIMDNTDATEFLSAYDSSVTRAMASVESANATEVQRVITDTMQFLQDKQKASKKIREERKRKREEDRQMNVGLQKPDTEDGKRGNASNNKLTYRQGSGNARTSDAMQANMRRDAKKRRTK